MRFIKDCLLGLKGAFVSRRFIRYIIVGTVNTINTALFSTIIAQFVQKNISGVLGYIVSMSLGYLLNCGFVFPREPSALEYFKFMLAYVPNFIIYLLMSTVTISLFGLPTFFATALAAIVGVPATYLLLRLIALKRMSNEAG